MYLYDGKPTASRIATIAATVISSVSVKPASLFMAGQFTGAGPYKKWYSVTIGRRADGRYPESLGRSQLLHITPANGAWPEPGDAALHRLSAAGGMGDEGAGLASRIRRGSAVQAHPQAQP